MLLSATRKVSNGDDAMKLLYVHIAEKLKEDTEGNLYTDGSYNTDVWDRYLAICDELTVLCRKETRKYDVEYAKRSFNPVKPGVKFVNVETRTSSLRDYLSIKKIVANRLMIQKEVLGCDCLIVRSPTSGGYTAVRYARTLNKPYLVEVVGCAWDSLWQHSLKGKVLALKAYLKLRNAVRNAPYVLYVTEEFLQRRYPSKGKSIGCSNVTLPTLDEKVLDDRLRRLNAMSPEKPIVLGTIGAVDVPYKGQEYVIKALARLSKQGYDFEYHLVGGGDNTYLRGIAEKNGIAEKVRFLGSLAHEKVFDYLDQIDVYIQPSKTEGLPRALIEAMSRGCPAVGSEVGGIPELLSKEFTFRPGSIKQICDLLRQLDRQTMISAAVRNFNKAKEFEKALLRKKRAEFYRDYVEYVQSTKHDL